MLLGHYFKLLKIYNIFPRLQVCISNAIQAYNTYTIYSRYIIVNGMSLYTRNK